MPFIVKGIFFVLLLQFFVGNSNAQFLDSIKTSFNYKPTVDFRIDTRNSFITHFYARIIGIKLGLDFNKTVKVGVGYNWLSSEIYKQNDKNNAQLKFWYLSPYLEYTFYRKEKWELSIPVLLGFGSSFYERINSTGHLVITDKHFMTLYEPYMTGQYKIIPWMGLGFGVGYRLIIIGSKESYSQLSSPIYVLKIKVLLGEIYRSMTRKPK